MSPRPKPLIGALLGVLLGAIVMCLVWILGIAPPDRLPLFAILAASIALTATLTTLSPRHALGRYVTAMVVAALCAGVALTGIGEFTGTGSLTRGCTVEATSSLEPDPRVPADTSATDPFDVTTTDTVVWSAATDTELDDARPSLDLMVGGFAIPLWNGQDAYSGELSLTGEDSVEAREQTVRDEAGVTLTGTFHFAGTLAGVTGGCEMDAYLRVANEGAFVGTLAIGLWVALAVVVILIGVVVLTVVRSLAAARTSRPVTDRVTTTGGTSPATFTSGTMTDPPDQATGTPPQEQQRADATAGRGASDDSARGRATSGSSERSQAGREGTRTHTATSSTSRSSRDGAGASTTSDGSSAGDGAEPVGGAEDAVDEVVAPEEGEAEPEGGVGNEVAHEAADAPDPTDPTDPTDTDSEERRDE